MARVRPVPLARGSRAWHMMPSSTSESWARICGCWWAGNTSTMRLMVWAAELVCRVPKVKWPVSAMRSADSMVSRSRISPMSTTSGSSRRAARSALVKEWVSACSSRWLTTHFLCACRYSIGSSIVIMCSWRSLLILSSIAARVVDLPEPVGPVTSTRPRGLSQIVAITGGQAQLLEAADLVGDRAVDGGHRAALHEDVGAEARQPLDAEAEVQLEVLLEAVLLRVGQHAVGELLGLHRGQRRAGPAGAACRRRGSGAGSWW